MAPKISIIVPAFNVAQWIEECATSALNQTFTDFEIIIVDDGSTDETPRVLQELKQRDSRITVITQENRGLSLARNAGLAVARGEYLLFLDGDDVLVSSALEHLYSVATKSKPDVVHYLASSIPESSELPESKNPNPEPTNPVAGRDYFSRYLLTTKWAPRAQLLFLSREFLSREQIEFFPGILHEDNLFTFTALSRASRVTFYPLSLYLARERKGSITRSRKSFEHVRGLLVSYLLSREEKSKAVERSGVLGRWGMAYVIERIFVQAGATFWSISWSERGQILRWLFSQKNTFGIGEIVLVLVRLERILYAGTRLLQKARFAALRRWALWFWSSH